MSKTYTDTITDNLNKLPERVRWQNNVTRLNQTNMNTIGSAIDIFTYTFEDLGRALERGFDNIDTDIKNIDDWKSTFKNGETYYDGDDLKDYVTFRNNSQSTLQSRMNLYKDNGIVYGGDQGFTIFSQLKPIVLEASPVNGQNGTNNIVLKAPSVDIQADQITITTDINRLSNIPIDSTCIHNTYEDAVDYAQNDPVAYVGQVLVVYDATSDPDSDLTDNSIRSYIITDNRDHILKRIATETDLLNKADINSPTFTGAPLATTLTDLTDKTSKRIATVEFVHSLFDSIDTIEINGGSAREADPNGNW